MTAVISSDVRTNFDTGNVANVPTGPTTSTAAAAKAQVIAFRDQLRSGAIGGTPEFRAYLGGYLDNVIKSGALDRGGEVYRSGVNAERQSKGLKPLPPDQIPLTREQGTDNRRINQLAYQNETLGTNGRSMSAAGCALASVTMMTNRLNNNNISMTQANQLLLRNGAMSANGDMNFDAALHVLGGRKIDQSSDPAHMQVIAGQQQQNNASTQLFIGVNSVHGRQSSMSGAGHFITGSVNSDGSITATDPAGGKDVVYKVGQDGYYHGGSHTILEMRLVGSNDPTLQVNKPIKA